MNSAAVSLKLQSEMKLSMKELLLLSLVVGSKGFLVADLTAEVGDGSLFGWY